MYKKIEQHKLEESFGLGKVMAPKLIPRLDLRFGYPGFARTLNSSSTMYTPRTTKFRWT